MQLGNKNPSVSGTGDAAEDLIHLKHGLKLNQESRSQLYRL
jgi:hypothetical protein